MVGPRSPAWSFAGGLPEPAPNRITRALDRARAAGEPLLDLTLSNPTVAGLEPDYAAAGLDELTLPASARYRPHPRGLRAAREAIAATIVGSCGVEVDIEDLVLCSCSSEAYGLLLKLLCDAGDLVLCPRPSYPLLEHLVRLEHAVPTPYPLRYLPGEGWRLDLGQLESQLSDDALVTAGAPPRALLVVNPNNPTGSYLTAGEAAALARLGRERGLALIADEVFYDYPFAEAVRRRGPFPSLAAAGDDGPLSFIIGGLSKLAGMPHLKLSWIAVRGPERARRAAIERLELISDNYLSLATPVQLGLEQLLAAGAGVRRAIQRRVERNLGALQQAVAGQPSCDLLQADGGWAAVLRVPALRDEEQLVLELLEHQLVIVHPGYFFDMPPVGAHLVVSLLCPAETFDEAIDRTLRLATSPAEDLEPRARERRG